jgi:hypothetical protein
MAAYMADETDATRADKMAESLVALPAAAKVVRSVGSRAV